MSRQLDPTKRKLTDVLCRNSKPKSDEKGGLRTIKHSDGYGLNLEVRHDGKFWFYAFRLNGKQLKLSLGSYPTVRLSDAREMHEKAWLMVQKGEDPREGTITRLQLKRLKDQDEAVKLEQRAKEEAKSHRTFRLIAEQWLIKKEPSWTYSTFQSRRALLQNDVFPVVGNRQISELKNADIFNVLDPISARGSTSMMDLCRTMLQEIFNYARLHELCENNPAEAVKYAPDLQRHRSQHRKFLEFHEMGDFLRSLKDSQSRVVTQSKLALEFLILTVVRSKNVQKARWEHFRDLDGEKPTWLIPSEYMKASREHLVPLSHQAVSLLERIKSYNWSNKWLFPGKADDGLCGGPLFKNIMLNMNYSPEQVHPHGFRSTFSTHANESGLWNRDAIEWVLAHSEKNEVRAAYNRAQYLEQRRQILQWWADQLDEAMSEEANGRR